MANARVIQGAHALSCHAVTVVRHDFFSVSAATLLKLKFDLLIIIDIRGRRNLKIERNKITFNKEHVSMIARGAALLRSCNNS